MRGGRGGTGALGGKYDDMMTETLWGVVVLLMAVIHCMHFKKMRKILEYE